MKGSWFQKKSVAKGLKTCLVEVESKGSSWLRKIFSCLLRSLNLRVTRILDVLNSQFLKLWEFKSFSFFFLN